MDKVSLVNASPPKLHPVSACFLFVLSQKTPGNGGLLEASLPKTLKPATLFYKRNLVNFLFLSYSCFQTKDFFVGLSITYAPGISTVVLLLQVLVLLLQVLVLLLQVLPTRAEEDKAATKNGSGGGPSQCSQVSGSPLR